MRNVGLICVGSDTGSSIRTPAAFQSLVGIRPTIGLISRKGVVRHCFPSNVQHIEVQISSKLWACVAGQHGMEKSLEPTASKSEVAKKPLASSSLTYMAPHFEAWVTYGFHFYCVGPIGLLPRLLWTPGAHC